jgi:hypothetical protein
MSDTERWCCDGLRFAYARREERGMYVFAEPPVPEIQSPVSFWLGTRAVAHRHLARVPDFPSAGVPFTVATWLHIKHCPWCGSRLDDFYRETYDQLLDERISDEREARA